MHAPSDQPYGGGAVLHDGALLLLIMWAKTTKTDLRTLKAGISGTVVLWVPWDCLSRALIDGRCFMENTAHLPRLSLL